jgi:hypothetical protein
LDLSSRLLPLNSTTVNCRTNFTSRFAIFPLNTARRNSPRGLFCWQSVHRDTQ